MGIAARIDDMGRPAWIGLLIVSFFVFPPLTLVIIAYLIWTGRMGFKLGQNGAPGQWQSQWQNRMQQRARSWGCGGNRSSGNWAFDEYRDDMIRRLEDEQQEFRDFLDRLRRAKDKAEFDQFMAERGRRRDEQAVEPQPQS
jgi:hypothetical protein